MNAEESFEKLSALMDDELSYHEALSLMGRLGNDGKLNGKLHRYAAARELMRSGTAIVPDGGFVGRVHAALIEEPVIIAPRSLRKPIGDRAATYAIAASMAVVALLVGRSLTDYSPDRAGELLAKVELNGPVTKASMEPDLRDYLALHNESAYRSGAQGILPSVRLVSGSAGRER